MFHITLSHYHHMHWTYKMFFRLCSVEWVSNIKSIFSVHFMRHMGLYTFSLPIYLLKIVGISVFHLIIIVKSKMCFISHCLRLGHEIMVCVICLDMFLYIEQWPIVGIRGVKTSRQILNDNCGTSAFFFHLPFYPEFNCMCFHILIYIYSALSKYRGNFSSYISRKTRKGDV